MQFKNPEILYFLALLIIPILVHLFQLQKFVKIPFSNVHFLKKIELQTRKSSRLKKWLILSTRLLLFSAILFAFSQPYLSNKKESKNYHNYIYLDNSLSTNSKGKKGNLLQVAIQEIIENASEKNSYSLLTNTNFFENITKKELKNTLLKVKNVSSKLDLNTILLNLKPKLKNKTKSLDKVFLISDFQNNYIKEFTNVTPAFSAIKLETSRKSNISIDSVFTNSINSNGFSIKVLIKNQGEEKNNVPIAIYNNNKLISKLSSSFKKDSQKTIEFSIQNQKNFNGKIEVTFSDTFIFDNTFYFTFNSNQKTNVLSIGKEADFLSKIYNNNEFNFLHSTLQNVNYNSLAKQQLIVLNELESIPEVFAKKIMEFTKNGGNLVIIPNQKIDVVTYNNLLKKLSIGKLKNKRNTILQVTNINYSHPLFKNVFSKKTTNFQYPTVKSHYPIQSLQKNNIVSFQDNSSFISQLKNSKSNIYWVSSSLSINNSNFTNSPLIVPVFYNFGKLSFQHNQLYYRINSNNQIDIETQLEKDKVLKIAGTETTFIPLQQVFQNKVTITTNNNPQISGIYPIIKESDTIQTIAFNYPKTESSLSFLDLNELKKQHRNITISNSVANVFKEMNKKNEVHWLWKWFLALAIVSLFLEILILKFYKS